MTETERVDALTSLLRAEGVGNGASVAGAHGDIAVVHGASLAEVQPLVDRIRELGFRHVTIDLATLIRESD